MNDILKLYYYDLKANRKKFVFLSALIGIWIVLSISVAVFSVSQGGKLSVVAGFFRDLDQTKVMSEASYVRLKSILDSSIILRNTGSFASYSFIAFVTLLSVLMSFDMVTREYKKKNSTYFTMANLPTKIYKMKIAKLLVGWSLYMFCILGFSLATLVLDIFWRIYLGKIYMLSSWSLLGDNSFLLTSGYSAILIMVCVVLPSIIGIQSLTSIFFVSNTRGKVFKKIICLFLLMVCGVSVFIFVTSYMFSSSILHKYRNISLLVWFSVGIYTVSMVLAYIDCKISASRTRGGVING